MMDGVTSGMRYAKVLYIISDEASSIAEVIMKQIKRGVTALEGSGLYSQKEKQVLMCVMSRREAVILTRLVKEMDEKAFVIISDAREVMGEGFQER